MKALVGIAVLVALMPLASADPILEGVSFCAHDMSEPFVLRACARTWDEPQELCLDIALGLNEIDNCVPNPDVPPEGPPTLPTPI